jgi:thioredoxin-dependent peroxiredoxin
MIEINTKAPDFILQNQDKASVSLSQFLGSYVLIYFYPKDDTPGCTKEACIIKEVYDEFKQIGITVLGISKDSPESHQRFRVKYGLPFTLLSDPEKTVIGAYGAQGVIGTKRISYLIDPAGFVIKSYPNVDPASHAYEILKDYKALSI